MRIRQKSGHGKSGLYTNYWVYPYSFRAETLNGFSYQGKQYRGNEPFDHLLQHGDVFRIGDTSGTMVSITFDDGGGDLQNILPQIKDIPLRGNTLTLGRTADKEVTRRS